MENPYYDEDEHEFKDEIGEKVPELKINTFLSDPRDNNVEDLDWFSSAI